MSLEDWDFEHQRLETEASVAEIRAESGLGKDARVDLDLEFAAAGDDADASVGDRDRAVDHGFVLVDCQR